MNMQNLLRPTKPHYRLGDRDIAALAELIRELGLSCSEVESSVNGLWLNVDVNGNEVAVCIRYNRFVSTGRIPGFQTTTFGDGAWSYEVLI